MYEKTHNMPSELKLRVDDQPKDSGGLTQINYLSRVVFVRSTGDYSTAHPTRHTNAVKVWQSPPFEALS